MPSAFLITNITSDNPVPQQTTFTNFAEFLVWLDEFMGADSKPIGRYETRTVVVTEIHRDPQ